MEKTLEHLEADLLRAIENLQAVVTAFDQGFVNVTISMAVAIRTLFHQTKNSDALLKQLNTFSGSEFETFPMISTMKPETPNSVFLFGDCLVAMQMDSRGMRYVPVYSENGERTLLFYEWWDENVIRDVRNGFEKPVKYSRKEVILTHADQEGGAHFDSKQSKLHDLGSIEAAGWLFQDGNGNIIEDEQNQKAATIRQIAYETLRSLFVGYPSFFRKQIF